MTWAIHPPSKSAMLLPATTVVVAALIFTFDSITRPEIAASTLYVAVVLLATRFCDRRGVIAVAAACMALTVMNYIVTPVEPRLTGTINTLIGLVVVALATFLVVRIESEKTRTRLLAESQQLRDAMIGSVSHELRTPLASILGGASVLAETPAVMNDRRLAALAEGIRDEAERLNSDIQNLLDAARITSRGLQTSRDWTDPTDIVAACVERARRRQPQRSFDLALGAGLPLIHVDPILIEQALGQIISNAIKFSPPDSTVHITAGADADQVTITVRDEGAGLTPDESGRAGERFFRGERHIGKVPGSGLGLWIAKTFIASNAGALEVHSEGAGKGTTVRITFPQSAPADDVRD